jgi:hypothetical protein
VIPFSSLVLVINSIFLIILILGQNDISKDTQNSKSSKSSLENFTWVSLIFQLTFLLIKIKTFNFN